MEKLYWKKRMVSKSHYNRIAYAVGIVVLGILYFFMLGDNGPYLMRDSEAFLNPTSDLIQSYWLYTNFLGLCKLIFGQEHFLYAVYILQGIFALLTSISLAEYFRKYYDMTYWGTVLVYVLTFLPYGYSLPENVVTHHILTEGLSIPLFHLCILLVCRSFLENNHKYMIIVIFLGVSLVLTRSQLLVFSPCIFLLIIIVYIKRIIAMIANRFKLSHKQAVLLLFLIFTILVCIVSYGVIGKTNIGSQFIFASSGRIMCLMDYEDRELFDGELQEIYDALYANANEGGHLEKDFRTDSWRAYDIAYHTNENSKECIYVIRDFYANKYPEANSIEYGYKSYFDRNAIMKTLLYNHLSDYIIMSVQLMLQSFVASVFIQPDSIRNLCYMITLFIYLGTFGVIYITDRKMKIDKKYIIPMLITLLFLVFNVVFTNIIFYGQQRYVIYTFGMFYISWFIIILGIYRKRKEVTRSE